MKTLRKKAKPVSVLVVISMMMLFTPSPSCLAAMIGTESVLDAARANQARQHINLILQREDVQKALRAQAVSAQEAKARVDALSDAEVVNLAARLDQAPAGGDALGAILFAALFVFIVLLVTDIVGYTDVFPFVKKRIQ
jgi:hypothetical protein